MAAAIELVPSPPDGPLSAGLVAQLLAELAERYPEHAPSPHAPRTFDPPRGAFLVALRAGEPVGCGGFRPLDDATAELKRMVTAPSARGQGVARRVLAGLEEAARAAGYRRLVLETGSRQPEAVALYRAAGYREVPAFAAYFEDSIYLGRELGGAPAVNIPHVLREVEAAFARYEEALVQNDVATLDALFWDAPLTLRYGLAEELHGHAAIAAFRGARPAAGIARDLLRTRITTFGEDHAVASTEFRRPSAPGRLGRQQQTWVRLPEGWRIVAAHVSYRDG